MEDGSIKVLKVSETKAFDMEGALKQVQKLIDGGMKTKEAIKRVAQEMNGSKNELYDAYHKHIWSCESRIFFLRWKNAVLDLFLFLIFSIFDKKQV